jgi:hypothetical protein
LVQGVEDLTQIENVPGLLFPYSQNRINIVEPGVRPFCAIDGINPLELPSSSQAINVKLLQVPE